MLKDFITLLHKKYEHFCVGRTLKDVIHSTSFQNFLFVLGTLAFVRACFLLAPETLTVSSSSAVNGRELPIYCVETDQKKVALSFDAAWGNI